MQTYVPEIRGMPDAPLMGADPYSKGWYHTYFDSDGDWWAKGSAVLRRRGGGFGARGSGFYLVELPVAAKIMDDLEQADIVGTGTFGFGLQHKDGNLHLAALGGAYTNPKFVVCTLDNGLFVGADAPWSGVSLGNVHVHFDYPIEEPA